jgi:hypothetical protein
MNFIQRVVLLERLGEMAITGGTLKSFQYNAKIKD